MLMYDSMLMKCEESLKQTMNDKHSNSEWTDTMMEHKQGDNCVDASWIGSDNTRVWFACMCDRIGLLTCGNTTTEVSCGCNDITHPAAVGIP